MKIQFVKNCKQNTVAERNFIRLIIEKTKK